MANPFEITSGIIMANMANMANSLYQMEGVMSFNGELHSSPRSRRKNVDFPTGSRSWLRLSHGIYLAW